MNVDGKPVVISEEVTHGEVQNRDIFESTDYKAFFEDSVKEEYEDFVYLISRGKFDEVIEEAENIQLKMN